MYMGTQAHLTPGLTYFYLNSFIYSDMQALTFKSDQLLCVFLSFHVKPEGGVSHFLLINV